MDRILPIDLEHPKFRMSFRGYDKTEVDELLSGAARALAELIEENERLRGQVEVHAAELDVFRSQDALVKETLLVAQKAADETRAAAQKNADALIEEARQSGMVERMAAAQHLSELRWELDRLKSERARFAQEFRSLLERHSQDLERLSNPELSVVHGEPPAAVAQA